MTSTSFESTNDAVLQSIVVSPNVAYSPLTLVTKNDAVVYKRELQSQFNMGNSDKRKDKTTNKVCQQPYYEEVLTQGMLNKVGTEDEKEIRRKQFPRSQSPEYTEITSRGKHLTRETSADKERHRHNLGENCQSSTTPFTPITDKVSTNMHTSARSTCDSDLQVSPNVAYFSLPLVAKGNAVVMYKENVQIQMGKSEKRKHSTIDEWPYYDEVSTKCKFIKVGTEEKEELQRKQFPRSQSPEYTEITTRGKHLTRETSEEVNKEKHYYDNLTFTVGENAPCTGKVEYSTPHSHHLVQGINNHSRLATVREDV